MSIQILITQVCKESGPHCPSWGLFNDPFLSYISLPQEPRSLALGKGCLVRVSTSPAGGDGGEQLPSHREENLWPTFHCFFFFFSRKKDKQVTKNWRGQSVAGDFFLETHRKASLFMLGWFELMHLFYIYSFTKSYCFLLCIRHWRYNRKQNR